MLRVKTDYIVVHCSATKASMDVGVKEIRQWHLARKFSDVGYHYVIRRDGVVEPGRLLEAIGAHVSGYNSVSVGVCMVGGLGDDGRAADNFLPAQWSSLSRVLRMLASRYPKAKILGHRDLSPDKNHDGVVQKWEWVKDCPSVDIKAKCLELGIDPRW